MHVMLESHVFPFNNRVLKIPFPLELSNVACVFNNQINSPFAVILFINLLRHLAKAND